MGILRGISVHIPWPSSYKGGQTVGTVDITMHNVQQELVNVVSKKEDTFSVKGRESDHLWKRHWWDENHSTAAEKTRHTHQASSTDVPPHTPGSSPSLFPEQHVHL